MSRILYIAPTRAHESLIERGLAESMDLGNELDQISFKDGPMHVEYHYYEALMLPRLVQSIIRAEQLGYDAAVLGCFYDFGLHEGREVTNSMVVTAPCESSVLLAASLGDTFSILVGRQKWIPQMRTTVQAYGLASRLASFRSLGLGVLDYHEDEDITAARFEDAGRKAIEEDGAEVIILGCTASDGFYRHLQDRLQVPVIDAGIAAIKRAEHLVELRDAFGWSHSKIGGYEAPPQHEIDAWDLHSPESLADVEASWRRDGEPAPTAS